MKNKTKFSLSFLENKVYFKLIRWSFHVVLFISLMVLVLSVFIHAWSRIPPIHYTVNYGPKPQKASYPEIRPVTIDEVRNVAGTSFSEEKLKTYLENAHRVRYKFSAYDKRILSPEKKVNADSLLAVEWKRARQLIDTVKHKEFWTGTFIKTFVGGERGRKLYRKTKNPKYIQMIPRGDDFPTIFDNMAKSLDNYEKYALLKSMNDMLAGIDSGERINWIKDRFLKIPLDKIGIRHTVNTLETLAKLNRKLKKEYKKLPFTFENYYKALYKFSMENPTEGIPFLEFHAAYLDSIPGQKGMFLLQSMKVFSRDYDGMWQTYKKRLLKFFQLRKSIPDQEPASALASYLDVVKQHENEIQKAKDSIDDAYRTQIRNWHADYERRLANERARYQRAKWRKEEYKSMSLTGMEYGLLSVFLGTLLLFIFMIIYYLKQYLEGKVEI